KDLTRTISDTRTDENTVIHSFPTRRSSDLRNALLYQSLIMAVSTLRSGGVPWDAAPARPIISKRKPKTKNKLSRFVMFTISNTRSEEHTSEVQSRENLVCRLLLAKKKVENP